MPVNRKLKNLLDGRNMTAPQDDNVVGGIPVLYRIDMAGGATATQNVTLQGDVVVIDVWVQNNSAGTASDTVQVFADTAQVLAITNAIDVSGATNTIASVSTIDSISASTGVLSVKETDGGGNDSPTCVVYILGYKA